MKGHCFRMMLRKHTIYPEPHHDESLFWKKRGGVGKGILFRILFLDIDPI